MEGRDKMLKGINELVSAVSVTMGAAGKPVIIQNPNGTRDTIVTRDGVTVAQHFTTNCPFEELGVNLVRQSSLAANRTAGDGTSAATVLAGYMINLRMSDTNNFITTLVERGMSKAASFVVEKLRESAQEVGNLEAVATVACNNNPKLGKLIAETYEVSGIYGAISVRGTDVGDSYLRSVQGAEYEIVPHNQYFRDSQKLELKNPKIILTDFNLKNISDFSTRTGGNVLHAAINSSKPVVVIVPRPEASLEKEFMIMNLQGRQVYLLPAPEFGEDAYDTLRDLAEMLGTQVVTVNDGDEDFQINLEELGTCKSLTLSPQKMTIAGFQRCEYRLQVLKDKLSAHPTPFQKRRLGRLEGRAAELVISRKTHSDLGRVLDATEDALNATRSALQHGIVSGGGVALRDCSEYMTDFIDNLDTPAEQYGATIVLRALSATYEQILSNLGQKPSYLPKGIGVNVMTQSPVNMIEEGIVDPLEVVVSSFKAAVEVAKLIPSVGAILINHD